MLSGACRMYITGQRKEAKKVSFGRLFGSSCRAKSAAGSYKGFFRPIVRGWPSLKAGRKKLKKLPAGVLTPGPKFVIIAA